VMAKITPLAEVSDQRKRWPAESCPAAGSREERQTMHAADSRTRRRKPLAAGTFQPEISSFRLALAAEGKAAKTVRNYTEAVQWFAAAHLIPQTLCTRWGAGQRARRPVVDGVAALPVQRLLHQQPVDASSPGPQRSSRRAERAWVHEVPSTACYL
jgi:hypothetical protein